MAKRVLETFVSKGKYEDRTDSTIFVGCSMGSCGPHNERFLKWRGCKLADRILVPGSVGSFVKDPNRYEDIRFLSKAHDVKLILAIQHLRCAFYLDENNQLPVEIYERQMKDMGIWTQEVKLINPHTDIELYYQEPNQDERLAFRPLYR
ncbi:hypothetical protein HYT00_02475 [Candidatus Giovannonibacteria bacterium]|nr:hypothetical protein [Candidatus Giovannonibacteria bacterium]